MTLDTDFSKDGGDVGLYADYNFYKEVYGGVKLSQKDFESAAGQASLLIWRETLGRASRHLDDVRLKLCCCAAAEVIHDFGASGALVKKSESVGAWSYTLSGAAENASAQSLVRLKCRCCLPPDWLYRGVGRE